MLTHDTFVKLFPSAKPHIISAIVNSVADLDRFGITKTPTRLAYFLAQLAHESAGFTIFSENLFYNAHRLTQVFPKYFKTLAEAQKYTGNPSEIANKVYANRMGNGNEKSGDGYTYRGRGAIQLTGRDTYRAIGAIVGLPLENDPALAGLPENLMLCAAGFWQWKKLNAVCDVENFDKLTRLINGGTNGLVDRKHWLKRILPLVTEAHADAPINVTLGVQNALIARGYHEVGVPDGRGGSRTRGAILAFEADNNLPLRGEATQEVLDAIKIAPDRIISDTRAEGMPDSSPVISSANKTITLGTVGGTVAVITPVLEQVETVSDLINRIKAVILPLLPEHISLPHVLVGGICCIVVYFAIRSRNAYIRDFRTGRLGK